MFFATLCVCRTTVDLRGLLMPLLLPFVWIHARNLLQIHRGKNNDGKWRRCGCGTCRVGQEGHFFRLTAAAVEA